MGSSLQLNQHRSFLAPFSAASLQAHPHPSQHLIFSQASVARRHTILLSLKGGQVLPLSGTRKSRRLIPLTWFRLSRVLMSTGG